MKLFKACAERRCNSAPSLQSPCRGCKANTSKASAAQRTSWTAAMEGCKLASGQLPDTEPEGAPLHAVVSSHSHCGS